MALADKIVESIRVWYKPGMMKWHYEHGLVIMAAIRLACIRNDSSLLCWVKSMYDPMVSANGDIYTYRTGEYNLDQINPGRNLFFLLREFGEKRYSLAIEKLMDQLREQPRCLHSNVFWHKEIYPWQIWLDGIYMQSPFRAEYAEQMGDLPLFNDIARQIITTYELMKDEHTGLLYHCYDESRGMRWSDEKTGLSPNFWLRAIGWYVMAIVDVLDYMPSNHPERIHLVSILEAILDSVHRYQDASGMWYQIPDKGGEPGNYLETSGSSMFAYVLFKSVRMGYLNKTAWCIPVARAAMDGIRRLYLRYDENGLPHLGGICSVAGLGGNPYRDGSFNYYMSEKVVEDDFKGVGPFLLALLEEELLDCK